MAGSSSALGPLHPRGRNCIITCRENWGEASILPPVWQGGVGLGSSCCLWNSLKEDLTSFPRARRGGWGELFPQRLPRDRCELGKVSQNYPKRAICSLAKQDNCLGQTPGCRRGVRSSRRGRLSSPSLFGKQLSRFLCIQHSPASLGHAPRSNVLCGPHRCLSSQEIIH